MKINNCHVDINKNTLIGQRFVSVQYNHRICGYHLTYVVYAVYAQYFNF